MLSDMRVLAMLGWPLLSRHQPGQPQPTVRPARRSDAGSHGDRQLDGLPVARTVAELPGSDRKG